MITALIAFLAKMLGWTTHEDVINAPVSQNLPPTSPVPPKPNTMPTKLETLYETAKSCLGQHMTLNDTVPISVGCAEAVSAVLKKAGFEVPKYGIAGTAELLAWLKNNSHFTEVTGYVPGTIIVSATGTGNGKIRGHTGILGESGIMSNESQTGLWREQWDMESWDNYYTRYGGIPRHLFSPID